MKNIAKIFLLAAVNFSDAFSQQECNLVRNWSFEDTVSCPDWYGQITRAKHFFQMTTATTDYFNDCTNTSAVSTPSNFAGYQIPRTGSAYAGIATYGFVFMGNSYREYISDSLIKPLDSNKVYYVSFYVSRANNSKYSTNTFGMYFNDSVFLINSGNHLPYTPQVELDSSSTVADSVSWTKISGNYLAHGGEKYITIGNFRHDSMMLLDSVSIQNSFVAYYYVDDISVILCSDTILPDTTITPALFPNPNNGAFTFNYYLKPNTSGSIYIYNMLGQIIYKEPLPKNVITKEYVLPTIASGIYYFVARNDEGVFYESKFVVAK